MTANDKQIDLLLRRYVPRTAQPVATKHLDADELTAFAEGSLPAAARAGYVSHLADCAQCRKQVAQLGVSAGVLRAESETVSLKPERTFWQVLTGLFSLPVLRYAAFGAVVLIVGGVAIFVARRSNDPTLIALNEPRADRTSAISPAASNSQTTETKESTTSSGDSQEPKQDQNTKPDEIRLAKAAPTLAPPATLSAPAAPVITDIAPKKSADVDTAKTSPTYAPAPPGEVQSKGGEKQIAGVSGPRQQQKVESFDKLGEQQRERDLAKDAERADDGRKNSGLFRQSQPSTANRAADEKAQGPMRNMENVASNRAANESRAEPPRAKRGADDSTSTEEEQTRSVGGRKFRRQGSGWVDQKFTSSMALKTVSRGSEEFEKLDSGLRSIAQQLSGQIIVVWKGKAYLIR
jgi:hypothetical protein